MNSAVDLFLLVIPACFKRESRKSGTTGCPPPRRRCRRRRGHDPTSVRPRHCPIFREVLIARPDCIGSTVESGNNTQEFVGQQMSTVRWRACEPTHGTGIIPICIRIHEDWSDGCNLQKPRLQLAETTTQMDTNDTCR